MALFQQEKVIFVTVGTTSFDQLIQTISRQTFLSQIAAIGYTEMIIQYGKGFPPLFSEKNIEVIEGSMCDSDDSCFKWILKLVHASSAAHDNPHHELKVSCYRFKSSIKEDMQRSSLIISHAGAGSIMESLSLKKKTFVVINDALMDNHQMELAEALFQRGYLFMVKSPDYLSVSETIERLESFVPKEWKGGRSSSFGNVLACFMGFTSTETKVD